MTSPPFLMAIDQGSSSTKVLLVDPKSKTVIGKGKAKLTDLSWPEIRRSIREASSEATAAAGIAPGAARFTIGISNQRSTLLFLDANGVPRGEVVSWWDRSGVHADDLGPEASALFRARTGLPVLPNWWAGKLAVRLGANDQRRPATVDTAILSWLTAGRAYATDLSNAARTGLVDLARGKRTSELLGIFGLRGFVLPRIRPSVSAFGKLAPGTLFTGLAARGRIAAIVGDAGAALCGATGGRLGEINLTLGTGGFVHRPIRGRRTPPDGAYLAPSWQDESGRVCWSYEISVPAVARAVKAGLAHTGLPPTARDLAPALPRHRVRIVSAPEGFGAMGPTRVAGIFAAADPDPLEPEQKLGEILSGIAFLLARAVLRAGEEANGIVVGGGLSRNDFLVQRIADLAGKPVARTASADASAWGAIRLAARLDGIRVDPLSTDTHSFHPGMSSSSRRRELSEYEKLLALIAQ